MKTISKIILSLIFLTALNVSASAIKNSNEGVVNKMSQDKNVQSYVMSILKINVSKKLMGDVSKSKLTVAEKEDYSKNINRIILNRNQSQAKMYTDYPELATMNLLDREALFQSIIKTEAFALNVSGLFGCISTAVIATAATLGAASAVYKRYLYLACLATTVTATLAAQSAVGPEVVFALVDTGVEVQIIEEEAIACAEMSFETTYQSILAALGALSASISTCVALND